MTNISKYPIRTAQERLERYAHLLQLLQKRRRQLDNKGFATEEWDDAKVFHQQSDLIRNVITGSADDKRGLTPFQLQQYTGQRHFGDTPYWISPWVTPQERAANWQEKQTIWKEKAKAQFDKTHRFVARGYSESLGADYGTFSCECCGRTFHHAPSSLFLGKNKLYETTCGYCVNHYTGKVAFV